MLYEVEVFQPFHEALISDKRWNLQELKLTLHATKEGMHFLQMKYLEEFNNLGTVKMICTSSRLLEEE